MTTGKTPGKIYRQGLACKVSRGHPCRREKKGYLVLTMASAGSARRMGPSRWVEGASLICALRGTDKLNRPRRVSRRLQGVHEKGLTGASPLSGFSWMFPVGVGGSAEGRARRLNLAVRRGGADVSCGRRREGAGPDGEFDQPDAPHALRLDSASDGIESI
jgi:hypothetical protein